MCEQRRGGSPRRIRGPGRDRPDTHRRSVLEPEVLSQVPPDAVREAAPVGNEIVDALRRRDGRSDRVGDLVGTMCADDPPEQAPIAVVLGRVSEPVFEPRAERSRGHDGSEASAATPARAR